MGVVGVGVDLVDVPRFAAVIARRPGFITRVFTEREIEASGGASAPRVASLAARWAAKEAVAKVLVDNRGLEWHHCEVLNGGNGEPGLVLSGTVLEAARARHIDVWHLSLSHDGPMAIAFVVAAAQSE